MILGNILRLDNLFRLDHVVTNGLAILGFLIIWISTSVFVKYHYRNLRKKLFTIFDGTKLFEKLKYDLKIDVKIENVKKERLYSSASYAESIFRGAMEYNRRDVAAYFQEKIARETIISNIKVFSRRIFWMWALFIVLVMGGSYFDFLAWLVNIRMISKDNTSGVASIFIIFFILLAFMCLIRWREFIKMRYVINDEVRKINIAKKEKVWISYKWVYFSSIVVQGIGLFLFFLNMIIE